MCEVLSPATCRTDRVIKMRLYRRELVPHVWLLDPGAQILEVYELDGPTYRLIDSYDEGASVRARPFDTFVLELSGVWVK